MGIDEGNSSVNAGACKAYLRRGTGGAGFDVVFLDPPYDAEAEYAAALGLLGGAAAGTLTVGAVVIAEHRRKEELGRATARWCARGLLQQGDAALSFY